MRTPKFSENNLSTYTLELPVQLSEGHELEIQVRPCDVQAEVYAVFPGQHTLMSLLDTLAADAVEFVQGEHASMSWPLPEPSLSSPGVQTETRGAAEQSGLTQIRAARSAEERQGIRDRIQELEESVSFAWDAFEALGALRDTLQRRIATLRASAGESVVNVTLSAGEELSDLEDLLELVENGSTNCETILDGATAEIDTLLYALGE